MRENGRLTIVLRILAGVVFAVIIPAILGLGYFLLAIGALLQGDFSPKILLMVLTGIAYFMIETGMFVMAAGILKPEHWKHHWAKAFLFFGIGFVISTNINGWNKSTAWMMVWLILTILSFVGFVLSLTLKKAEA